ncbi:hypothetical protein [Limnohabitans sp.]|uniref:hypothetical protein n=1 Tax=Limnohabitans sp. TaxID=1907725 RepID=UPI003919FEBD
MDALIGAFIALGLLILLVLILYLVDRVNTIERETRRVAQSLAPAVPADPWGGLSGRALWEAMTGKPPAGLDAQTLAELKERYDLVLHRHIEGLYQEGLRDGSRGMNGAPLNTRVVSTARGPVESWLPQPQVNALYQCGLQAAQTPVTNWGPIRQAMDEAGQILYDKVQIQARPPLSGWLMPDTPATTAGDPSNGASGTAPPS